jgi:hypothetical protein
VQRGVVMENLFLNRKMNEQSACFLCKILFVGQENLDELAAVESQLLLAVTLFTASRV